MMLLYMELIKPESFSLHTVPFTYILRFNFTKYDRILPERN